MALNCIGMFGGGHGSLGSSSPGSSSSSWSRVKTKNTGSRRKGNVVVCVASSSSWSSVMDPYKTLNIKPGASESEVKKAFRQLALRYHPDVCRETDCNVQFSLINEAYDRVMEHLREESSGVSQMYESSAYEPYDQDVDDEGWRGMMSEPDWELWEEWMGWEGAGIRDYTSHINPYI